MAIYHLEAKMVSRGAGRSAVAASAYLSCSRMLNEYDGVQHDYTRKQGLVWQAVFLPDMAPVEWQDREKLWNAVEETEKTKDSRLAREFVAALPIELSRQQQIALLQKFVEKCGYERVSKYPKSTKYGRQNPISARWNSEEHLLVWREAWATAANRCLELAGHAERIDHRSHAARGLEERPTVHEGVAAQVLERRGILSDRCELNRQIKADNALLRELKAELKKLSDLVVHTVSAVAERLEKLRGRVLIFCYQLSHIRAGRERYQDALHVYRPQMARYNGLVRQIKDKSRERKALLAEKKALPARKIFKHKELAARIAELTEDLEELRSEKALLLQQFEYAEDAGAETFRKDIAALESNLEKLDEQEQKYSAALDAALHEYAEVKSQAAGLDPVELYEARQAIRLGQEAAANEKLEQVFGSKYSLLRWMDAKQAQIRLTNDSLEEYAARQQAKQKYKSISQPVRKRNHEQER